MFAFITVSSLMLAWYVSTPGPPRLDTTNLETFQRSVKAIEGPLWDADEKRFRHALGHYLFAAEHYTSLEFITIPNFVPAELWLAFPVHPERVDVGMFDRRIDELNGLTGYEIIDFVEQKHGPLQQTQVP